jgi:ribosomal protein S27AE
LSEFEQKVLKLLEEINGKLDSLLKGGTSVSTPTPITAPTTQAPAAESEISRPKPSELVERQKEQERLEEKPPVEGRRICPDCGSTAFATHEDKSQVLHQMGGVKIYAKKYVCKQCGYEY